MSTTPTKTKLSRSLGFKHALFMVFAIGSIMFIEAFITLDRQRSSLIEDFSMDTQSVTVTAANSMSFPLWDFDTDILDTMTDALIRHPNVVSANVIEPGGDVIAQSLRTDASFIDPITKTAPISSPQGDPIGTLSVTFSRANLWADMKQKLIISLTRNLIVCVLVLLVAMWAIPSIILPIKRLQAAVKNYDGRKTIEAAPGDDRQDEIGSLARGFRDMATQIHENVSTLEARVAQRTQALSEAVKTADSANEAKSAFLANMSHEIRTPMNGILGMAQVLENTDLTAKQKTYVKTINESGFALVTIINDILDYSKIEAGKVELDPQPFHLGSTIGDVASLLGVTARDKGLELLVRIRPDVPRNLIGDAGRIRQVVTNLLGNAIKFTHEGFVLIEVSADSHEDRVDLTIEVKDTGIGISDEKLETIFDEFTQAEQSTTRQYGGTGLGLSITRTIVELMGGTLSVTSDLGKGSNFKVDISLQPSGIKIEDKGIDPTIHFDGQVVLSVDDNKTNQSILKENLTGWGLRPIFADSAKKALLMMKQAHEKGVEISLVLSDFHMPEHNGLDLVRAMRRFDPYKDTPVIVLSSATDDAISQAFKALGVAQTFAKPVRLPLLKRALQDILSKAPGQTKKSRRGETRSLQRPAPKPSLQGSEKERRRALIVDDNEINREVLIHMLEERDFQIDEAQNGKIAYQKAQVTPYDIIFMDISMPVMDGMEAMRAIRAHEAQTGQSQTPIIAVTAHAMQGDRERMVQQGMSDYLAKPFDVGHLETVLKACAEQEYDEPLKMVG